MNWMRRNVPPKRRRERLHRERLREPGHALEQHVAVGEQPDQEPVEQRPLADDHALDLGATSRRKALSRCDAGGDGGDVGHGADSGEQRSGAAVGARAGVNSGRGGGARGRASRARRRAARRGRPASRSLRRARSICAVSPGVMPMPSCCPPTSGRRSKRRERSSATRLLVVARAGRRRARGRRARARSPSSATSLRRGVGGERALVARDRAPVGGRAPARTPGASVLVRGGDRGEPREPARARRARPARPAARRRRPRAPSGPFVASSALAQALVERGRRRGSATSPASRTRAGLVAGAEPVEEVVVPAHLVVGAQRVPEEHGVGARGRRPATRAATSCFSRTACWIAFQRDSAKTLSTAIEVQLDVARREGSLTAAAARA